MKTARTGKPWKLLLIAGLAKARRPQNGTLRATTHSKRKRRPGAYRRRSAAVLRAQRKTWRSTFARANRAGVVLIDVQPYTAESDHAIALRTDSTKREVRLARQLALRERMFGAGTRA